MPDPVNPLDKIRGDILQRLIQNGIQARSEFLKTGKEIERYGYSRDYQFEYSDYSGELYFKAKVAKTAQYLDIVGSYLYQSDPDRRANPREFAGMLSRQRAALMQKLLNLTPKKTRLAKHSRSGINESLTYGRGVMWTGWSETLGCPQSVHETVDNILVDPDAKIAEEIGWVARKRTRPRWELINRYPGAKAIIQKLTASARRVSDQEPEARDVSPGWERQDFGSDQIAFYECYFIHGLHHYKGGDELVRKELQDAGAPTDKATVQNAAQSFDDSPRKYVFAVEGSDGTFIAEEDWEIPFWRTGDWPSSFLDLRERPGSVWPASPLEPGLGFQKALNWLHTFYMSKMRVCSRTLIAICDSNGQGLSDEERQRAMNGNIVEFIRIKSTGGEGMKIGDFIQQLDLVMDAEQFETLNGILAKSFEDATGLSEYLISGSSATQPRSAEEVKLKDSKSRTRIEDQLACVVEWQSRIASKEAMVARYLMGPQQIAPLLGPEAAQLWGEILPQEWQNEPGADQLGVVFDSWCNEVDYDIMAGSIRRKDLDQAIDAADASMNQLVPTLIQEGGIGPASAIMANWAEMKGLNPDVADSIKMWATHANAAQQQMDQLKAEQLQLQNMQAQMQIQQLQQQIAMQQQQAMNPQQPQTPNMAARPGASQQAQQQPPPQRPQTQPLKP